MINIYAPINLLGYGIHANNIIKSLTDANVDTNLTTIGQIQNDPYFEAYWKKAHNRKDEYDSKHPSLFIFHDEYSNQASGTPMFVFSIFETTKLKNESLKMLRNGPADVILTTTHKHKELLESHNIEKPVMVVNEGIDEIIFNTIPVDKHIETNKFTYITVGKKEKRKNTSLILNTFINEMSDKEVALISHTFNPFANTQKVHPFKNLECWSDINPITFGFEYKGWDGKCHKFTKDKCDIYFTAPGIQTAEMGCLYHSANVGIQISRGEGWDLPLTEMMACGVPTIASNCLGHSEYLPGAPKAQQELIVPCAGQEVAKDGIWFKGTVGNWDIIDEDAFKNILLTSWNNRTKYESKSEELSEYMENNYSWSKAAATLTKILN